jgi:hypothetical protein
MQAKIIKKHLIPVYRPADYHPDLMEDETMTEEIDALNAGTVATGVRVFVG